MRSRWRGGRGGSVGSVAVIFGVLKAVVLAGGRMLGGLMVGTWGGVKVRNKCPLEDA